jgi:hypothetical protein
VLGVAIISWTYAICLQLNNKLTWPCVGNRKKHIERNSGCVDLKKYEFSFLKIITLSFIMKYEETVCPQY